MMLSESRVAEPTDVELGRIATELRDIANGSSWSRTLATGELILKHFFGGKLDEWRTHRRQKESSIRRLAQRPDCPLGRSALSEAVSIYVARKDLPQCVDALTPSHVAVALRLPLAERLAIIEKAVAGVWSVREIRHEALLLKRRAGERRGRPRFSQARSALSQFQTSLDALESGLELLGSAGDADANTVGLLERALSALESRLGEARVRVLALGGPSLRSAQKLRSAQTSSLVMPASNGTARGVTA